MSNQVTHSSEDIHSDQIHEIPNQTKSFQSRKRRIDLNEVLMNTGNDSNSDSSSEIPPLIKKRRARYTGLKPIVSTLPRKSKPVHSSPEREYIQLEGSSESEEIKSSDEPTPPKPPTKKYHKSNAEINQLVEDLQPESEKYGMPFEDRFSKKRLFAQTEIILDRVRLLNAMKRMDEVTLRVNTEIEFVEDEPHFPMVQLDSVPRRTIYGAPAAPRSSHARLEAPTQSTRAPAANRTTSSAAMGGGSSYRAAPQTRRAPTGLSLNAANAGPPRVLLNYLGHDIPISFDAAEDGQCQFCGAPDHSRDGCGLAEMEHPQINQSSQSFV